MFRMFLSELLSRGPGESRRDAVARTMRRPFRPGRSATAAEQVLHARTAAPTTPPSPRASVPEPAPVEDPTTETLGRILAEDAPRAQDRALLREIAPSTDTDLLYGFATMIFTRNVHGENGSSFGLALGAIASALGPRAADFVAFVAGHIDRLDRSFDSTYDEDQGLPIARARLIGNFVTECPRLPADDLAPMKRVAGRAGHVNIGWLVSTVTPYEATIDASGSDASDSDASDSDASDSDASDWTARFSLHALRFVCEAAFVQMESATRQFEIDAAASALLSAVREMPAEVRDRPKAVEQRAAIRDRLYAARHRIEDYTLELERRSTLNDLPESERDGWEPLFRPDPDRVRSQWDDWLATRGG